MKNANINIAIVGGGFAGVQTALELAKSKSERLKITLISDTPHFTYTPALYRVVTGRSPLEVCIQLTDIFNNKNVEIVTDTINKIDLKKRVLIGASQKSYEYDYLALALGSETSYFDTPGLKELSFGFKSIEEALELKKHLHETFKEAANKPKIDKVKDLNFVIVGGGASGTELSAELALYTKSLAKKFGVDPSFITIDLIQSPGELVPALPDDMSEKVKNRLHSLGVNVFLNRRVVKEELETILLKDMELKTKTVIWTAGVAINKLYKETIGLMLSKKGRVLVDKYLRAKSHKNVFILGDGAETTYTGMAQTAVGDGKFAATNIFNSLNDKSLEGYKPKKPVYAIPVGPGWAAVFWKGVKLYGIPGWILRRTADLRFFLSILPPRKAALAFWSKGTLCTECGICTPAYQKLFEA